MIFATVVVMHIDRMVLRSAFGPPQDDILADDIPVRDGIEPDYAPINQSR
jgi:hypothetical protein